MKLHLKFITVLLSFLMSSCFADIFTEGTKIDMFNYTGNNYEKATLYVGAIKDDQFIVTDSIVSNGEIKVFTEENKGDIGFPHWNPDLSDIRKISGSGVLYCYINDELSVFFHTFDMDKIQYNQFNFTGLIILHKDSTFWYQHGITELQNYKIIK